MKCPACDVALYVAQITTVCVFSFCVGVLLLPLTLFKGRK